MCGSSFYLERVKGRAAAPCTLGRVPSQLAFLDLVKVLLYSKSKTFPHSPFLSSLVLTSHPAHQPFFFFCHKPCLILFVCFSLNVFFFSLCSHLFQLSDSIKQMRHHQTLHTLLHHPLQPFPGCREGGWEGGMIDGREGEGGGKQGVGGLIWLGFGWISYLAESL